MCYLTQLILAARNSDGDDSGWMNLLVFIVVAVFYGLGGILKAKAGKIEVEEEEELPPPNETPAPHPPRRKISRRIPDTPKITPQSKPADKLVNLQALEVADLSLEAPTISESLEELGDEQKITVGQTLFDADDTDQLKRAILYHEVLGKPLSLRDPH